MRKEYYINKRNEPLLKDPGLGPKLQSWIENDPRQLEGFYKILKIEPPEVEMRAQIYQHEHPELWGRVMTYEKSQHAKRKDAIEAATWDMKSYLTGNDENRKKIDFILDCELAKLKEAR